MTLTEQRALLAEWLDYLESQVGKSVYVWAAQGQRAGGVANVEEFIRSKSQSADAADRAIAFYHQIAGRSISPAEIRFYDCSGLGMYFWKNLKKIAKSDMTADKMYKYCEPVPHWSQMRPGDWVFKQNSGGKMYHIGYVARDGQVIEAVQSGQGVEKHPLKDKKWTHGGRLAGLADAIVAGENAEGVGVIDGTDGRPEGGDAIRTVKQWQTLLLMWDPGCLKDFGATGTYSDETDDAVIKLINELNDLRIKNGAVG